MSTGPGPHGADPARRQPPAVPDSDGAGHREESTFADVLNSLTLDSGRGRRKRSRNRGADTAGSPDPAPVDDQVDPGTQTGEELPVSAEAIPLPAAEETGFVRPYAITGGRTKPSHTLELETLISTRDVTGVTPELLEHRAIIEECRTPRSVAEIAATLEVPIGVARVLISDAADAGLVTVHRTVTGSEGAEEHLILMERVLSGLRRL